jgi:polyhydroxyalkanoate synthase subunit PhaC
MLTGRAARRTTWRMMDEWITGHSSLRVVEPELPEHPDSAAKPGPRRTAIGSNPRRRHGSPTSRGLAQKR